MKTNKKGQLGSSLAGGILFIIVIATLVVVSLGVLNGIASDEIDDNKGTATCNETSGIYTGCSAGYNSTQNAITGAGNISGKLPLIATIIVSVFLLGLVIGIVALFRR